MIKLPRQEEVSAFFKALLDMTWEAHLLFFSCCCVEKECLWLARLEAVRLTLPCWSSLESGGLFHINGAFLCWTILTNTHLQLSFLIILSGEAPLLSISPVSDFRVALQFDTRSRVDA